MVPPQVIAACSCARPWPTWALDSRTVSSPVAARGTKVKSTGSRQSATSTPSTLPRTISTAPPRATPDPRRAAQCRSIGPCSRALVGHRILEDRQPARPPPAHQVDVNQFRAPSPPAVRQARTATGRRPGRRLTSRTNTPRDSGGCRREWSRPARCRASAGRGSRSAPGRPAPATALRGGTAGPPSARRAAPERCARPKRPPQPAEPGTFQAQSAVVSARPNSRRRRQFPLDGEFAAQRFAFEAILRLAAAVSSRPCSFCTGTSCSLRSRRTDRPRPSRIPPCRPARRAIGSHQRCRTPGPSRGRADPCKSAARAVQVHVADASGPPGAASPHGLARRPAGRPPCRSTLPLPSAAVNSLTFSFSSASVQVERQLVERNAGKAHRPGAASLRR